MPDQWRGLLRDAPRGELRPCLERILGPLDGFIGVAGVAGIGNLQGFRGLRRNEFERMAAHIDISNGLLDLRHMAADTFVAG